MTLERSDAVNTADCFKAFHVADNIVKCTSFNYDTTGVSPDMFSAVMEFNLVCDSEWKPRLIKSMTFVGLFIGAALSGYLSDTFG